MPFVTTLIKLALFALWARPTYKMTVEMLEMRERRHGILPPEKDSPTDGETGTDSPRQPKRRPSDTQ